MAWNEPGGSGSGSGSGSGGSSDGNRGPNRNPWGKRPQSGPPDLDEWIRNLQRKFSGVFGGGGGRGGDSSNAGGIGIGVILGGLVVVWLLTGMYQNGQAERAVILRFGKFYQITGPGLNWRMPWPVDSRIVVNVERIDSFTDQTRMLTADENMVDINLAVQFRRADPKLYALRVSDPDATLRQISESAIREVIGRSELGQVLESGRQDIAARTKVLIQKTLSALEAGIEVTSVNLQGVAVPEQVAAAQQDAIRAGNDKERATLEAQQYANDILPKAKGAAIRQVQEAQGYRAQKIANSEGETMRFMKLLSEYERAPGVTRQRLYIETMQEVMGRSKKVLIDAKGSNNMLYVPVDKLLEQSRMSVTKDASRDPVVVTRVPPQTVEAPVEVERSRGTR